MADKELRKLNRAELIEIIVALQGKEEQLELERDQLRRALEAADEKATPAVSAEAAAAAERSADGESIALSEPAGNIPAPALVRAEQKRLSRRKEYRRIFRSAVLVLLATAAAAVLLAVVFLPVLEVSGNSMEPTLKDGDVIVLFKTKDMQKGDLLSFYFENKLLLKRVIGLPGDLVDIDKDGTVRVNQQVLDEPYVSEKVLGNCDLDFPLRVPDDCYFVLGDHRGASIDSRSSLIGCVDKEKIVGKILLRVWPWESISAIH